MEHWQAPQHLFGRGHLDITQNPGMCVVPLQVTLYGAGPGSLNATAQPVGLVRSGIFNTVGTCSAISCQYTTTQPCEQKNSAGGELSHSGSHMLCCIVRLISCSGSQPYLSVLAAGKDAQCITGKGNSLMDRCFIFVHC